MVEQRLDLLVAARVAKSPRERQLDDTAMESGSPTE